MREPEIPWWRPDEYEKWARENKKRADRLLAAAKDVLRGNFEYQETRHEAMSELYNAAVDYEDKIG